MSVVAATDTVTTSLHSAAGNVPFHERVEALSDPDFRAAARALLALSWIER